MKRVNASTLEPYAGRFIVNITGLKINKEYHFMYRAVNLVGSGPNSTIFVYRNVAPPNGRLDAPLVTLNVSN